MSSMTTVGGVRYRVEDAIRLGLVPNPKNAEKPEKSGEPAVKKRMVANKAAKPANKAK